MRIISGSNKGKKLIMPNDKTTRPLKDMAKESVFNILTHAKYINFHKNHYRARKLERDAAKGINVPKPTVEENADRAMFPLLAADPAAVVVCPRNAIDSTHPLKSNSAVKRLNIFFILPRSAYT